ncbi:hypothetical protein Psuf_042130 [Phytohabitans suffuscus]|uniref:Elp3/MiaA/NifB-like radical SAM core domain-containing protein n=2 Tax=Phytohabitans suffuscus TaxID=624315 RepID=A0A6F8YLC8_9ACTN|nr:hypothetical protein Psuf_042130 [Phytohabitans suffuscus]
MYINQFSDGRIRRPYLALGDHGKDRPLLSRASRALFERFDLLRESPLHVPDTADPVAGMHYGFDAIEAAVDRQLRRNTALKQWVESALLEHPLWPPASLGISVMGPSQVFMAALIAKMAKMYFPETITILGGSHVTLLSGEMSRNRRYLENVDMILPGHSEQEFVEVISALDGTTPTARTSTAHPANEPMFDYIPLFSPEQLALYPQSRLTLPVQFTRGCYYARCTYCTYPVVEPQVTKLYPENARAAFEHLANLHGTRRFSIKDSLFTPAMLDHLSRALLREPEAAFKWSVTTKVSRQLIKLAPRLASAGLATVELGVETIHSNGQRLFDKFASQQDIEDVVLAFAHSDIVVIVNLIFGLPGETIRQAQYQLAWFQELQRSAPPGMVDCSLNMLEVVRGSPLAVGKTDGVEVRGIAPWAYCYDWNAPAWRRDFAPQLTGAELRPSGQHAHPDAA